MAFIFSEKAMTVIILYWYKNQISKSKPLLVILRISNIQCQSTVADDNINFEYRGF